EINYKFPSQIDQSHQYEICMDFCRLDPGLGSGREQTDLPGKRNSKGIRHVKSLAIASYESVSQVPAIEKGLEKNIGEEIKTDPTALTDVNTGSGV
ncbi:unnamed protein product, partial [Allacma fusca]